MTLPLPAQGKLILDEGFDGSALNDKLWSTKEPWFGSPGVQQGPDAWLPVPPKPGLIEVSNGTLKLRAKAPASSRGYSVDAAFITTRDKFSFTHGYVEAKVALPALANAPTKGLWTAFWLLGDGVGKQGWPVCGEVDIFEVLDDAGPGIPFRTDHWGPDTDTHYQYGVTAPYPTPIVGYGTRWVTFGLLRTTERLVTYIDNEQRFVTTRATKDLSGRTVGPAIFDNPMHIRFDMSAGNWDKKSAAVTPGQLEVDYVRVWDLS